MGQHIINGSCIVFVLYCCLKISTCLKDPVLKSHPEDVTAHIGQTIKLKCEFEQEVNKCTWFRRGTPVEISHRYAFADQPKCTIEISDVKKIDFGEWICGTTDGNNGLIKSNPAILSEQKILDVQVLSKDDRMSLIKMELDDDRVLVCGSQNEEATDYAWQYRVGNSDEWQKYSSSKILELRNVTAPFLRCSATVSDKQIYSNEYLITFHTKVTSRKIPQPMMYIGTGFLTIVVFCIFVAAVFVIIYFCYHRHGFLSGAFDNILKFSEKKYKGPVDPERHRLLEVFSGSQSSVQSTNIDDTKFQEMINKNKKQYQLEKYEMTTTYNWMIRNYSDLKKQHENATEDGETNFIESDIFKIEGSELKMRVKLYLNGYSRGYGTYISAMFEFVNNGVDRSTLPPFYHKRTILILDQRDVDESDKNNIFFDFEVPFGSNLTEKWMKEPWAKHRFVRQRLVEDKYSPYLKDNTLKVRVIIEPLTFLWKYVNAYNGVLEWKIPNFTRQRNNEMKGLFQCLRSEDFYTHPYGYRCKLVLFLDGNGNGHKHHMSIYLGFIKGEWDKKLAPLFAYRVRFSILNQIDRNGTDIVRVDYVNPVDMGFEEASLRLEDFYGHEKFAEIKRVNKEPYLVDDQIIVKVEIEPLPLNSSAAGRHSSLDQQLMRANMVEKTNEPTKSMNTSKDNQEI